jgi:hypothetical protein
LIPEKVKESDYDRLIEEFSNEFNTRGTDGQTVNKVLEERGISLDDYNKIRTYQKSKYT